MPSLLCTYLQEFLFVKKVESSTKKNTTQVDKMDSSMLVSSPSPQDLINDLAAQSLETRFAAVKAIKNAIIGNKARKSVYAALGAPQAYVHHGARIWHIPFF